MGKKKSKKKLIILIIIVLLAVISIIALSMRNNETEIKVTTEKVGRRTITQTVTAIGKIQPETQIKVSSQTSGEVIFLGVEEGDTVKTNQMLVKIKPDIIETQLEQFKASVDASKMEIDIRKAEMERAKQSLQRISELYQKEFASQEEFERVKTAYDQAVSGYKAALSRHEQTVASYKQVQRSAERTIIYSPINGIVTKLNVEKGEKVVGTEMMAGTEMMIISDLTIMNAEVDVDENDIILVHIGDTARIEIDAFPDKIFNGVVKEIGHSAITNQMGSQDQVTNFKVKIRLLEPEAKMRPGMSCSVEIETITKKNVLAVPLQSVTVRASAKKEKIVESNKKDKLINKPQSVVFIKSGNKAKKIEVETGISDNGYIEIVKGLKDGQEVISGSFIAVSKELEDGSMIKLDTLKKKKTK
ncbi:efflux RND transporter periplasmic adaptor subunit [Bacteroidetes/Chlorobi group bacterium ChocPot_Mid]|nr:MAG: efflux RND transporter periplasmic adaptor subunit [Bacteroidetes/Chlorobi group bacterium ChocPot_Mid]